jgi:hypothetical protein
MDLQWLNISLFSCKDNWHIILKKGINPFIEAMSNKKIMNKFQLEFNYYCGENIRMSLLTKHDLAHSLAKSADNYFRQFLSRKELSEKEIQLALDRIFMPFPCNTIQYGLYNFNDDDVENLDFKQSLSELIIKVLGEQLIDEEILITFAFYLHISLLKITMMLSSDLHVEDRIYKEVIYRDVSIMDYGFIKEKYNDNKGMLIEIYSDIMEKETDESIPDWLNKWMELCKKQIRKNDNLKMNKIVEIYKRIIYMVYKQLGINDKMESILSYFIQQVFLIEISNNSVGS